MPGQTPTEAMMMRKQVPPDPIRDKMRQSVKWAEEYKVAVVALVSRFNLRAAFDRVY